MRKSTKGANCAPVVDESGAPLLCVSQIQDMAQALTGKRPSPSTVFRWLTKGAGGSRLAPRRVGGRLYATRQSVAQWFGCERPAPLGAADKRDADAVAAVLGKAWGTSKPAKGGRKGGAK